MNMARVQAIVEALLYEGYILYPYRSSSVKNRQRWTFGGIFPCAFRGNNGDASDMQTQVLLCAGQNAEIDVRVRFLQISAREVGKFNRPLPNIPKLDDIAYDVVAAMEVDGTSHFPWDEAVEREIVVPSLPMQDLRLSPKRIAFNFESERHLSAIPCKDGVIAGVLIRTTEVLQGFVEIVSDQVAQDVFRVTVKITNETILSTAELTDRSAAQRHSFASTLTILTIRDGQFISLLDPPDALRAAAAACENHGTWPVMIGEEGDRDTMLSSPIILYDYPSIAPESPGNLFDGSEIDEILTLRILAMTEEEKREMAATDARGRALLHRTESLSPAELSRLHGAMRVPNVRRIASHPARQRPAAVRVWLSERESGCGRRLAVTLSDLALKDKLAVVEAIERDFEDRLHVAVTLFDDPGRDLGAEGFPGHRFYFSQEEVEPLGPEGSV